MACVIRGCHTCFKREKKCLNQLHTHIHAYICTHALDARDSDAGLRPACFLQRVWSPQSHTRYIHMYIHTYAVDVCTHVSDEHGNVYESIRTAYHCATSDEMTQLVITPDRDRDHDRDRDRDRDPFHNCRRKRLSCCDFCACCTAWMAHMS
jgi:hypothetical protein